MIDYSSSEPMHARAHANLRDRRQHIVGDGGRVELGAQLRAMASERCRASVVIKCKWAVEQQTNGVCGESERARKVFRFQIFPLKKKPTEIL